MINENKKIFLVFTIALFIIVPSTSFAWHDYNGYGDWNYYGSGRDHPYSAYIDRATYVGPDDYVTATPDYVDAHLVLTSMPPTPPVLPAPTPASGQADQFNVQIPNVHGGYNIVVIKKSGDGFVGPQGEYYPEFPKIFQLEIIYGR